jgi:threonine dehydratase
MSEPKSYEISLTEALKAKRVVEKYLSPTPLILYEDISSLLDAEVYVKHENHNPTGTFKVRGGVNLLHHIQQADFGGVITFSTGNHGLSIAQAAKWYGLSAKIVVPEYNNPAKNRSIVSTGAELIEAGSTFEEASAVVERLMDGDSLYYAHPANEPQLINGVCTEFLEIVETLPDLDAIILPIGAGSEVAAAVTVLKTVHPEIEIYAVQAKASSAAYQSWSKGHIVTAQNTTFAGGFATGTAYEVPFDLYKDNLTDFVLLTEEEIYEGIALGAYYTHNFLEGAGAATIMAAIKLKHQIRGKKVVLQFSGANASTEEIRRAYSLASFDKGWA